MDNMDDRKIADILLYFDIKSIKTSNKLENHIKEKALEYQLNKVKKNIDPEVLKEFER